MIIPEVVHIAVPNTPWEPASWMEWYVWTYEFDEWMCMYEQTWAMKEGLCS